MKTILLLILTYITYKIIGQVIGLSYNPFDEGLSLMIIVDFLLFCIIGVAYHCLFFIATKLYKS